MSTKNISMTNVMKTLVLHNFVSIASEAFVPTIDMIMGHKKQFFNLSDKRVKELFFYELDKRLKVAYGQKVIILNSCHPIHNWRNKMFNHEVFPYRLVDYELSMMITERKLFDTLEGFWKLLVDNPSYITLRNKELDSDDLEDLVLLMIGRSHIRLKRINHDHITDLNSLIDEHKRQTNQVPIYLKQEIERELRNKNLLA